MGREAGDARGLTFQTPEPAVSRPAAGMRGHRGRRDVQSVDRVLISRVYFEWRHWSPVWIRLDISDGARVYDLDCIV